MHKGLRIPPDSALRTLGFFGFLNELSGRRIATNAYYVYLINRNYSDPIDNSEDFRSLKTTRQRSPPRPPSRPLRDRRPVE